ncbi:MAG: type II toxin-antitoxin system RelE/ParE family toxin [Nitrospira sp.]|nr:type II toxin-antitoxin system RelE/ParE family toxin [Nitrospira sp.]
MDGALIEIRSYVTEDGDIPFSDWLDVLRDERAQARILVRLDRVRLGNFGDCVSVGEGVKELRIDYGPGYRVYVGQAGATLVLLLCGGDKRTQARDIRRAKACWKDYKRRTSHASE